MQKKKYILNIWHDTLNVGTSCVCRTENKSVFDSAVEKYRKEKPAMKNLARIVEYGDFYIMSWAENPTVFNCWYFQTPKGKVNRWEIIRL